MPGNPKKRHNKLKKRGKKGRHRGPVRSTVDVEEHLLSRPFVSKPIPELPTSVEQIRIRIKKLPEDLKGTVHRDGRITIPLDAKHRASNWREIQEHLERLSASEEEVRALAAEVDRRILSRLKRSGRITEAWVREDSLTAQISSRPQSVDSYESPASHDEKQPGDALAYLPQHMPPKKGHIEINSSGQQPNLGTLSVKELFQLAKDIQGLVVREGNEQTHRTRSQVVKAFAKAWANGICQFCGNQAQYGDKDGTPRLHVHHIVYLENEGEDSVENVVAICPNCHDIIHIRQDEADADFLKLKVQRRLSQLV